MPDRPTKPEDRAIQATQRAIQESGPLMAASWTLVGGIVGLGGLGYAIDAWRGTGPWGLIIGLTLGVMAGFYQLIKTVWRKQ